MRIVELTIKEFDEFASSHPLRSYCQSSAYARFMGEQGYSYDYVGFEDNGVIIAASLILYRRIRGLKKYAYAPKGFLIDYYNSTLVAEFTKKLTKKLKSRGVVFLKINPEVIIAQLRFKDYFMSDYNKNVKIIDDLKNFKYKRRREVVPFELIFPRISAYVNLKKYDLSKLSKDTIAKVEHSQKKGLIHELATSREINIFYNFIKSSTNKSINYYRTLLNIFSKVDMAELMLIKVNYREFLIQAREEYEKEVEVNNQFNQLIQEENNEENLTLKMESDKLLLELKNNIIEATEGLKKGSDEYIGGAVLVKYQNRVTIIEAGFDPKFASLNPYHFLYNKIFEIYKENYDYVDLNGLTSDFSPNSAYSGANKLKLEFKPTTYEFIGEFDIIINESTFRRLQNKNLISKEMKYVR